MFLNYFSPHRKRDVESLLVPMSSLSNTMPSPVAVSFYHRSSAWNDVEPNRPRRWTTALMLPDGHRIVTEDLLLTANGETKFPSAAFLCRRCNKMRDRIALQDYDEWHVQVSSLVQSKMSGIILCFLCLYTDSSWPSHPASKCHRKRKICRFSTLTSHTLRCDVASFQSVL